MKLEHQVCTLALGRRLKELGVEQDSQFYWVEHPVTHEYQVWFGEVLWCGEDDQNRKRPIKHISAFTVAELGEMLPAAIDGDDFRACRLHLTKDEENRWDVGYLSPVDADAVALAEGSAMPAPEPHTLAVALATLLVRLLENRLLTRFQMKARKAPAASGSGRDVPAEGGGADGRSVEDS